MTDPKHSNITMAMVTLTLNTMDSGKSHNLLLRLLQSLLHKTQNTLMSFHLSTSPDGEESTTDPKHSNITMEMVTLTHNMTDHGKFHNPLLKLLQLLLHKTQSIPMNYHLSTSLNGEESTTDPKHSNITMEMVTLTHNMTDHGKFHNPLLKLLQLLLHKTQSIPMNYHLSTSLDGEENMIDHRLSSTMMVMDT